MFIGVAKEPDLSNKIRKKPGNLVEPRQSSLSLSKNYKKTSQTTSQTSGGLLLQFLSMPIGIQL